MLFIQSPYHSHPLKGRLITQMTTEGVSRIRRERDYPTSAYNIRSLLNQAGLGIIWMYLKELTQ
jgi:hypothetical protein